MSEYSLVERQILDWLCGKEGKDTYGSRRAGMAGGLGWTYPKGKFARSEDLRRRFRRDIKKRVMAKVEGLFCDCRPVRQRREPVAEVIEGRKPVLEEFVSKAMKLRGRYKGATLIARVRRDGTVRFGGKVYTSPSLAAAAARRKPTCNGWKFWQYERAPGDWVLLNELRK